MRSFVCSGAASARRSSQHSETRRRAVFKGRQINEQSSTENDQRSQYACSNSDGFNRKVAFHRTNRQTDRCTDNVIIKLKNYLSSRTNYKNDVNETEPMGIHVCTYVNASMHK